MEIKLNELAENYLKNKGLELYLSNLAASKSILNLEPNKFIFSTKPKEQFGHIHDNIMRMLFSIKSNPDLFYKVFTLY